MEYVQTIFLGIVQGIAEFLPISSSGHLVIVQALLGDGAYALRSPLTGRTASAAAR